MSEFASVLRSWRNRVTPSDVGLPAGSGRRSPGLRREELAALANVSVDYVVRLEQGRALHPSPQLLNALAIALRLDGNERDHLYWAAGAAPPSPRVVPQHITPRVHRIIDRLGDVPMAVFTAAHEGIEFDSRHEEDFASDLTADLRTATGRYPHDEKLARLVSRLRSASPDFDRRWSDTRVADHRSSRKTVTGTPVGPITVDCDVLTVPGGDLRIVVYTVTPGSEDEARLDLLRVTGLQTLSAETALLEPGAQPHPVSTPLR